LSEVKKELDLLAEKNQNLKQRNQRLNQTKENQMKRTLDEYKDYTKRIQTEKRCEKEEVMAEMKDLWNFKQGEEREVSSEHFSLKNKSSLAIVYFKHFCM
jgi:hypothetical protein